jgi:hypothetical protein
MKGWSPSSPDPPVLSRLLDPLELEGIDSARPVLAACHALGDWLEQKPRATRSVA